MRDGATVRALLFAPENAAAPGPLVVNFHGGGWVAGGPELGMQEASGVCKGFGGTYIAVDYRKVSDDSSRQRFKTLNPSRRLSTSIRTRFKTPLTLSSGRMSTQRS